jgi:hypothetical protein
VHTQREVLIGGAVGFSVSLLAMLYFFWEFLQASNSETW